MKHSAEYTAFTKVVDAVLSVSREDLPVLASIDALIRPSSTRIPRPRVDGRLFGS
jgi:hypothetical protein